MTKLIIILSTILIIALICSFIFMNKNSKDKNSVIELKCNIFTTIISPVLTVLSVILVVYTLQIDSKNYRQDKYNTEFSILFAEMKDFIDNLSVEIKYNKRSKNPIILSKMEVIDELAYYLKCDKKVRQLYSEEVSQINFNIPNENTWFTTEIDDFYIENGNCYQMKTRPKSECIYFESINTRFRNIFKPIFDLLANTDNIHRETHKHLFASYMNKNSFEAYLTTRWQKQDIPNKDLIIELIELSY